MTKQEFLDELEEALVENNMLKDVIDNNVKYYDSYISYKLKNGEDIDRIIGELGSGRVIAKTIVEADKKGAKSSYYNTSSTNGSSNTNGFNEDKKESKFKEFFKRKKKEKETYSVLDILLQNMSLKSKIKLGIGLVLTLALILLMLVLFFKAAILFIPYIIAAIVILFLVRIIFG